MLQREIESHEQFLMLLQAASESDGLLSALDTIFANLGGHHAFYEMQAIVGRCRDADWIILAALHSAGCARVRRLQSWLGPLGAAPVRATGSECLDSSASRAKRQ